MPLPSGDFQSAVAVWVRSEKRKMAQDGKMPWQMGVRVKVRLARAQLAQGFLGCERLKPNDWLAGRSVAGGRCVRFAYAGSWCSAGALLDRCYSTPAEWRMDQSQLRPHFFILRLERQASNGRLYEPLQACRQCSCGDHCGSNERCTDEARGS